MIVLAGLVALWGSPPDHLPAQAPAAEIEIQLQDAELEYTAAQSEWESALNAFRAAEARWQRALDDVNAVTTQDDEEELQRALARFHTQAVQLETQEARERDTAQRLGEALVRLMDVLALSRDQLYQEAIDAVSPEETQELAALWEDRNNRHRELQQEAAPPLRIGLVTMPEIEFDPRDGPDELDGKIRLLELRARQIDAQIQVVDTRVEALQRQQRQERDLQNLMSGVERFDDTFLPVTSPDPLSDTTERDSEGRASSADAPLESLDELSLEEQIEGLQLLREQMFDRKQQMETRAEAFRQRLLRMTTS
jgi:hypothetical protein